MSRYRTGPILIAAGISAAVVLALVGFGAWLLADDDDGNAPPATAEASETPTASETPSSTETGSATPEPGSATASPSASASATPGGEVIEWTVTAPAALPQDIAIYVEKGCYNCDGPTTAIERTTSIGHPDALVVETRILFEAPGDANRYISSWWISPRGTDIWVMVCSRGYCGSVAQPSADAQETLHHSDDGGITWSEIETFDGSVGIVHVSAGIPVLASSEQNSAGQFETTYFTLQGDSEVEGPEGATPLVRNNSEELIWHSEDGKSLLRTDGSTIFSDERAFLMRGTGHPTVDTFLINWRSQQATGESEYGLIRAGEVAAKFAGRTASGAPLNVAVGAWLSEDAALGNSQLGPGDVPGLAFEVGALIPVAIDFKTGALTPLTIYGPEFGEAYRGRNFISAVDKGPTGIETPYIVDTGGECLNMRETPAAAAPVVRCWADGVILWAPGKEPTQADGISWIAVYGPDGSNGWASAEFLKR